MIIDYKYLYLFSSIVLGLFWLLLFLVRRDLRREILVMSLVLFPLGVVLEKMWYFKDYWQPEFVTGWPISVEDALFGFFLAGISAVIYEELAGKRFINRHKRSHNWLLVFFVVIILLTTFVLTNIFNINSIYSSSLGFLISATIIITIRKDLIKDALISGIFIGGGAFFGYQIIFTLFPELIKRWWMLENISGIMIIGVPIEEVLWFFSVGMFIGPIYEFIMGLRFQESKKRK